MNSTIDSPGRFGNHFFRNMVAHLISIKNNIKFNYSFYEKFKKLGIIFFIHGNNNPTSQNSLEINDKNFMDYINRTNFINNNAFNVNKGYFQTREFCHYLKSIFYTSDNIYKNNILNSNIFKQRYNKNNDLYIHVRIGDLIWNKDFYNPFDYYDKALQKVDYFNKGYISTDSPEHEICVKLINKYNLELINYDEVETIMFASTCKNIVLSQGTFSWLIGFLSFNYSNVYFPKIKMNAFWHGDIFVFPEWKEIEY